MKTKLSETLKENGIGFSFPIVIRDASGKETYFEGGDGYWIKREYDTNGNQTHRVSEGFWCNSEYDDNGNETYYETSNDFWSKREYDAKGNQTYYENSEGGKRGTPKSQSCDGKVIEVDGKKYKLQEL